MPVTVTLGLQVKLDKLDEFKGAIKGALPDTRAYPGCIGIQVYEDQDTPGYHAPGRMGLQGRPCQVHRLADRDRDDGRLGQHG